MALTIETHGEWVIINGTAVRKNHVSTMRISYHDSITSFLEITLTNGKTLSWDAGRPDSAKASMKQLMELV